jgi:hypothetical protein
LYRNAPANIK